MRHFGYLGADRLAALFLHEPRELTGADARQLGAALGATLYAPGTRNQLADDVLRQAAAGVRSMVLCLEDAVSDDDVPDAEVAVVDALRTLADTGPELQPMLPLLFVRVRDAGQLHRIATGVGAASAALAGFVLPKFTAASAPLLSAIEHAESLTRRRLWVMPVLESPEIMYRESRIAALHGVCRVLRAGADRVLALRIGATDLSGLFGLRRDRDLTIYDIAVVRDCIADIVNVCGRDGGVITGPVWEYFAAPERLFVSPLRHTPFEAAREGPLRRQLLSHDLDRLIREVVLDKANGLLGKTVIHPGHVAAVHALLAVTHEEYVDACTVLAGDTGGVRRSPYGNKMNELRPHRAWAQTVQRRANAFGVLRPGHTFIDLLAADGESKGEAALRSMDVPEQPVAGAVRWQ